MFWAEKLHVWAENLNFWRAMPSGAYKGVCQDGLESSACLNCRDVCHHLVQETQMFISVSAFHFTAAFTLKKKKGEGQGVRWGRRRRRRRGVGFWGFGILLLHGEQGGTIPLIPRNTLLSKQNISQRLIWANKFLKTHGHFWFELHLSVLIIYSQTN